MEEELIRFKNSKEWLEFDHYCRTGFLEQIDFFRYEDVHTNFLASLLNPNNEYNLGTKPLQLFLELIKIKDKKSMDLNLFGNYEITNVYIDPHHGLENKLIPDLYIEFEIKEQKEKNKKYIIIIENKLFSGERDNQTKDYQTEIEKNANDDDTRIYVYLSLEKAPKISADYNNKYKNYIKINYQDLIEFVLDPCALLENGNNASLSIKEYLKSFTFINETDYDMPITCQCAFLTKELWNKYPTIIENILKIKNNDYKAFFDNNQKSLKVLFYVLSKDKKGLIGEVLNKLLGNMGKFNGKTYGCHGNKKMLKDILKDMIQNTKIIKTIDDLNKLKLSQNDEYKYRVALTEEQYKMFDKKDLYKEDEELKLEGQTLYYADCINHDELKSFVKSVREYSESFEESRSTIYNNNNMKIFY